MDREDDDRMTMPVWTDKDAYSFCDKMKNYCGDLHSRVFHDQDESYATDGRLEDDYEVNLDVVFRFTEGECAGWLGSAKYRELSKKVYRKMHYALTKFDSMALGDVDEGDGRGVRLTVSWKRRALQISSYKYSRKNSWSYRLIRKLATFLSPRNWDASKANGVPLQRRPPP